MWAMGRVTNAFAPKHKVGSCLITPYLAKDHTKHPSVLCMTILLIHLLDQIRQKRGLEQISSGKLFSQIWSSPLLCS